MSSPRVLVALALASVSACASACASSGPPRVLRETVHSPPRVYEHPLHGDRPFEIAKQVEDGVLRVHLVPGPCVTTTETFTRIQEVTIVDGRRVEGDFKDSVERQDSPPHACSRAPEDIEVRLTLPPNRPIVRRTDANGDALLPLPDAEAEKLWRSAHGVLSVGRYAADVPLEPMMVSYLQRTRPSFGAVSVSDVVASSSRLSSREVLLEIAISPRNAKNEFAGVFLPEKAFRFEGVELVPADGGPGTRIALDVEHIEIARPGEGSQNVALVLDSSGSMRDNDPRREGRLQGGDAIVRQVVQTGSVAVLDFGMGTTRGMREARLIQDFTRDERSLQTALRSIGEGGGTPLYTSLKDALALLSQRGIGGGSIVALTDGQAQDAQFHREVIDLARQQGVALFAIGLGTTLDFADLRHLGLATGGAFAEARDAVKLAEAFRGVGIGLAYGRVRVFARGTMASPPAPGRYRVRGKLVTTDPDSPRPLVDAFDTLAILDDGTPGATQMTVAAGGCNPDCYYDASCNVLSTGAGQCCAPIENAIHGPVFAAECRARAQLTGP